jgi:hypothetical protein
MKTYRWRVRGCHVITFMNRAERFGITGSMRSFLVARPCVLWPITTRSILITMMRNPKLRLLLLWTCLVIFRSLRRTALWAPQIWQIDLSDYSENFNNEVCNALTEVLKSKTLTSLEHLYLPSMSNRPRCDKKSWNELALAICTDHLPSLLELKLDDKIVNMRQFLKMV